LKQPVYVDRPSISRSHAIRHIWIDVEEYCKHMTVPLPSP
jgi:hypothetical protein